MQAIIWGVCLTTERGGKGEWAETERGKGMILLISSIFENWDLCFLFIIFYTPKKLSLYDVQIPKIIKSGQKEENECNSLWIIISQSQAKAYGCAWFYFYGISDFLLMHTCYYVLQIYNDQEMILVLSE
jgi:hypothetical protein